MIGGGCTLLGFTFFQGNIVPDAVLEDDDNDDTEADEKLGC